MRQTLLHSLILLCFPVAFFHVDAHAQTAQPTFNIENGSNLPQGYMALISDYRQVQLQMVQDIRQGRGVYWRQWLQPGVERNDSFYWWLLAEWYYRNNRADMAYQSAVQAVVLQRIEMSICGMRTANEQTSQTMLGYHKHIVELRPTQETIRLSILKAVTRIEDLARNQRLTNGMSCYVHSVRQAKEGRNARPITMIDYNGLNDRNKNSFLRRQNSEIRKIKEEFSYEKVWSNSEMNDLWRSIPQ